MHACPCVRACCERVVTRLRLLLRKGKRVKINLNLHRRRARNHTMRRRHAREAITRSTAAQCCSTLQRFTGIRVWPQRACRATCRLALRRSFLAPHYHRIACSWCPRLRCLALGNQRPCRPEHDAISVSVKDVESGARGARNVCSCACTPASIDIEKNAPNLALQFLLTRRNSS